MPVYKDDIPQPTDRLSLSQVELLNNFAAIKALVDVNHETFTGGISPEGKHKFMTMPEQGAAPTTLLNEGGLYAKVGVTSGATELFFRREDDGDEIAMTEGGHATPAGWTYLPSDFLVKWGKTGAPTTFNLNTALGPNFSALQLPFIALCTSTESVAGTPAFALLGGTAAAPTLTLSNVSGGSVYWLVIGV